VEVGGALVIVVVERRVDERSRLCCHDPRQHLTLVIGRLAEDAHVVARPLHETEHSLQQCQITMQTKSSRCPAGTQSQAQAIRETKKNKREKHTRRVGGGQFGVSVHAVTTGQ